MIGLNDIRAAGERIASYTRKTPIMVPKRKAAVTERGVGCQRTIRMARL